MANDIRLIQLNNYVKPEIVEDKRNDWVLNGKDNDYFKYVNERYIGSPTNATILNAYKNLTLGKGLKVRNASKNASQYAEMLRALPKKDVRKMVADYVVYNNAALQIVPLRNGKKVASYIDVTKLAFEKCDEQGEIKGFYYSKDWSNVRKNPPTHLKAFGYGGANEVEILYINDNADDSAYYSLPTYQSGLQYAEMEEEISNYYISHIKNGFSFGYIVNMNGGVPPTEDERQEIERRVKAQMTGSSNAGKIIISFNEGKDAAVEIVPLEVSDSHKQWENINQQSEEKIMRAHGVVSPMLFGVKNSTGLGNNAQELETGLALTMDMRVNPIQNIIIEHLQEFMTSQDIVVDLYFEPLNAKELAQEMNVGSDIEEKESVTDEELKAKEASYNGAQISSALEIVTSVNQGLMTKEQGVIFLIQMLQFTESDARKLFKDAKTELSQVTCSGHDHIDGSHFLIDKGEEIDLDEWQLITEETIQGEPVDIVLNDAEIQLAKPLASKPQTKSEQDNALFKVRYVYRGNTSPERAFCKAMMSAKKVYRKEDIDLASQRVIQAGMGPNGANTYNIFLYKGGVNCRHFWQRQIYLRRNNKKISVNEARRRILELEPSDRADVRLPNNPKEVAQIASPSNNFWKLS